jgi:DNA-binding CsgD family transcriptional regulator
MTPPKPYQLEIIRGIADGYSNKELAEILHYTNATLETYRGRLIKQYGCRNGFQLVSLAYREGWLALEGGAKLFAKMEKINLELTAHIEESRRQMKYLVAQVKAEIHEQPQIEV